MDPITSTASTVIYNILESLDGSPVLENMCRKWRFLAKELGVPSSFVDKLRIDSMVEEVNPRWRVEQILLEWRLRLNKDANMVVLVRVLEDNFKWVGIQEILSRQKSDDGKSGFRFTGTETWAGLPKQVKQDLLLKPIHFMGFQTTLLKITGKLDLDDGNLQTLYQLNLHGKTLFELATTNTFELAVNNIPEELFYIPRKLSSKILLAPIVYLEKCEDLFLVVGGDSTALSMYIPASYKITEFNAESNCIQNRIMISKDEACFQKLCKITTKAVHLITYMDGQYFWRKSRGSIEFLKKHLSHQVETEEQFLKNQINRHNSSLICFMGSSGMGKTTVLRYLARATRKLYNDRIVIYLKTATLMRNLQSKNNNSTKTICNAIASIVSNNDFGQAIMIELLENSESKVELFLDDVDEICWEPRTWNLINHILCHLPNFRIIVSTDSEGEQEDMEKIIGIPVTKILSFEEQDKVTFLNQYWTLKHRHNSNKKVMDFVTRTLSALKHQSFFLLETPFRLKLLAKTETENLQRYIAGYQIAQSSETRMTEQTLFQKYFEKVILLKRDGEQASHVCQQALQQLYPKLYELTPVQSTNRCSILVESIQFHDQQIAVYLSAKHLVDVIPTMDCKVKSSIMGYLLKPGTHAITGKRMLRHSLLCHYINLHLEGQLDMSDTYPSFSVSGELMQLLLNEGHRKLFCFLLPQYVRSTEGALVQPFFAEPWTSKYGIVYTCFHAAAESGNESLFQHLMSKSMPIILSYLPHVTLNNSHWDNDEIIQQKARILKHIIKISDGRVLQEKSEKLPEPLLMAGVHIDLIKLLIENGANLHSKTPPGNNLVHNVASYMPPDIFHHFAERFYILGADHLFQESNEEGETAIQVALKNMHLKPETLQLLINANNMLIDKDKLILQAIKYGYGEEMLKVLMPRRWTRQCSTNVGNLHAAIQYQNTKALEYFLKNEESPDRTNDEGKTPLHSLFQPGISLNITDNLFELMFNLLLKFGANKKSVDSQGVHPLSYLLDV